MLAAAAAALLFLIWMLAATAAWKASMRVGEEEEAWPLEWACLPLGEVEHGGGEDCWRRGDFGVAGAARVSLPVDCEEEAEKLDSSLIEFEI